VRLHRALVWDAGFSSANLFMSLLNAAIAHYSVHYFGGHLRSQS
jgi:hypothetical protein